MTWNILICAMCCIEIIEVQTIRESACVGMTSRCGYSSLSCSNGSRIQVDNISYGIKQSRCTSNSYQNCKLEEIGCCAKNSTDCFLTLKQDAIISVLEQCSGRSSCEITQAVQINMTRTGTCYNNFSNYVSFDYSCLNDTLLLNIGTSITLTKPEVNVIFHSAVKDAVLRNQSTNYTCTIMQTGYEFITLELVDIRIQKPGVAKSCSSVKISIPDANFSAECSDINRPQNFVYRQRSSMHLNNEWQTKFSIDNMFKQNSEDYPEMIWIKIQAYPTYTVSVTCRDQTFLDKGGDAANITGIIIGVLVPVLFVIGVAILGLFFLRKRYRKSLEMKAVLGFQNEIKHESPVAEHNTVGRTLSNSTYSEIDNSVPILFASHCSNEEDYYLEPSRIPEELAPGLYLSSDSSESGFDKSSRDKSETYCDSDTMVLHKSDSRCINTVENKGPKQTKENQNISLRSLLFKKTDISGESQPVSDATATKPTETVLKVQRSADNYIEFIQGELYDKPLESKVTDTNFINDKQKNSLPITPQSSDEKSNKEKPAVLMYDYADTPQFSDEMLNKEKPAVLVYDYADPNGGAGNFPSEDQCMEENMYEAFDNDHRGNKDDNEKANELFKYEYATQESSSMKYYNIDTVPVGNETIDDSYEQIQTPKEISRSEAKDNIRSTPPPSQPPTEPQLSSSPVSYPSSTMSATISTRSSSEYVNSPRRRATNKPITASKPNATDGYANSPELWSGRKKFVSSEISHNRSDVKNQSERRSDRLQTVLSVSALKLMFESQGKIDSCSDKLDSEA